MDTDASVMEGNDIEDLGGGSFRTADAVRRYSRLDQYAMGLVSPAQVPTFFYVENPSARERGSSPSIGVSFTGMSNHGSMGEHQVSHYIDCFAGERHPGKPGKSAVTPAEMDQNVLLSTLPWRQREWNQYSVVRWRLDDQQERVRDRVQCFRPVPHVA